MNILNELDDIISINISSKIDSIDILIKMNDYNPVVNENQIIDIELIKAEEKENILLSLKESDIPKDIIKEYIGDIKSNIEEYIGLHNKRIEQIKENSGSDETTIDKRKTRNNIILYEKSIKLLENDLNQLKVISDKITIGFEKIEKKPDNKRIVEKEFNLIMSEIIKSTLVKVSDENCEVLINNNYGTDFEISDVLDFSSMKKNNTLELNIKDFINELIDKKSSLQESICEDLSDGTDPNDEHRRDYQRASF